MNIKKRFSLVVLIATIFVTGFGFGKLDTYAATADTKVSVSTADFQYHQKNCKLLGADKFECALSDAVAVGFTACAKCKAPKLDVAKTAANNKSVASGDKVWLSATGQKYHKINNCGKMNPNTARQVTLEEAKSLGMEACKKCY